MPFDRADSSHTRCFCLTNILYCDSSEGNKYLGYVDTKDIVRLISRVNEENTKEGLSPTGATHMPSTTSPLANLPIMVDHFTKIVSEDAAHVINICAKYPITSAPLGSSIMSVIELMKDGASRVAIFDTNGRIAKIITQSDVIQLLNKHLEEFNPSQLAQSVRYMKLGVTMSDLVYCTLSEPTLSALKKMSDKGLSALPVLDADGNVVTNISGADVRVAATGFADATSKVDPVAGGVPDLDYATESRGLHLILSLPVGEFIDVVRSPEYQKMSNPKNLRDITVDPDVSVGNVIMKLAATRNHRLYIVEDKKLIGVITLQDVIRELF